MPNQRLNVLRQFAIADTSAAVADAYVAGTVGIELRLGEHPPATMPAKSNTASPPIGFHHALLPIGEVADNECRSHCPKDASRDRQNNRHDRSEQVPTQVPASHARDEATEHDDYSANQPLSQRA